MKNPIPALVKLIKREPAIILTVAGVGVGVVSTLGLHLTPAQTKDVYAAVAAATGLLIRARVTPTSAVADSVASLEKRLTDLEPVVNGLLSPADRAVAETVEADVNAVAQEAVRASTPGAADASAPAALALQTPPPAPSVGGWRLLP